MFDKQVRITQNEAQSFWLRQRRTSLSVNIPFVLPGTSPVPLLGISKVTHVLQSKVMLMLANLRCNYMQSDVYVKIEASV